VKECDRVGVPSNQNVPSRLFGWGNGLCKFAGRLGVAHERIQVDKFRMGSIYPLVRVYKIISLDVFKY
jgi:hypothetical protein